MIKTPPRFSVLLASLLLTYAIYPFIEQAGRGQFLFSLFFSLVMLAVIYSLSEHPRFFRVGLLLVVLGLGAEVAVNLTADTTVRAARGLVTTGLIAAACVVILTDVLRAERVTFQKICGAISVYMLFGILCANLYMWMAVAQPGAFAFASGGEAAYSQMLYYSVVTLTTLGYGDISPVAPSARVLASLEALLGQLYLAVLIARLVALHITQEGTKRQ